jgi:hypothetical protein
VFARTTGISYVGDGLVVATLSGSAAVGWLAALAVAGALFLVNRRRAGPACGLPRTSEPPFDGLARRHGDDAGTLVGEYPAPRGGVANPLEKGGGDG